MLLIPTDLKAKSDLLGVSEFDLNVPPLPTKVQGAYITYRKIKRMSSPTYPYLVKVDNHFTKNWQDIALFKSAIDAKLFVRARCQLEGEPENSPKYRTDFRPQQERYE